MARLTQANKKLKSASTNNEWQEAFLPYIIDAETKIKKAIVQAMWRNTSKNVLRLVIERIVGELARKLPKDLMGRQAYLQGMIASAERMMARQYEKARSSFLVASATLSALYTQKGKRSPDVSSPEKLTQAISKTERWEKDIWAEAKGSPNVYDYQKQVKAFVRSVGKETTTVSEGGSKPISVWQKAELDIRHQSQMDMVSDLIAKGEDLCWISSHPDCSKRCEPWQGVLVSLTQRSRHSGFRVAQVDGIWVYSLPDITGQVDKYGYKNNIIVGFNCRHRLIPYTFGSKPPKSYTKKEVREQRRIETDIRAMERDIVSVRQEAELMKATGKAEFKRLTELAKAKERAYQDYCWTHGYATQPYRIDITLRK